MNVTLKIIITKEYKLLIQINSEYKEEINPCICFNGNFISIGNEKENSIHFMKDWIENPEQFTFYTVEFQGKEYQLLSEVLFAIIVNEYKQTIEKKHILENTILELPTDNKKATQRIKISLYSIGLRGMEIEEDEQFSFDYKEQGEYLEEIIEKKQKMEKYQRMIERAKEIKPEAKEKLNQINLNDENILDYDQFEIELSKTFSTIERREMKLCTLDNYCIFIASRYFDSLDDHINLTKVSKKYKLNMEKFHYNGISLDANSLSLFPNIETLHIYEERDKYLDSLRIQRYVNWNRISYYELEENRKKNKGKEIEYKRIVWTMDDTNKEYKNKKPTDESRFDFKLTIPEGVNEIDGYCFDKFNIYLNNLKQITIPSSIKTIPMNWIPNFDDLTNVTLPLNESQIILGNKILNTPHLKQDIYLPTSIQLINRNKVDRLTSIEIPTTVTSLDKYCFHGCYELKELKIPPTVKTIPKNCVEYCLELRNITLPLNESQIIIGNKIFKNQSHLDQYIYLPNSIRIINGKEVERLSSLKIPTTITSLDENCFYNCYELQQLTISTTVKTIPKKCIECCTDLTNITLPLNESQMIIGNKIFNTPHLEQYICLPDLIQIINGNEVEKLTSLEIPTIVKSINWNDFDEYRNVLKEITIPTTVKTIPKNCIEICYELTNITLPLNESQVIIGNKIFKNQSHLEQDIILPTSIQIINGKEVGKVRSFEIPATVTSLDNDCFNKCNDLKQLIIPSTVKTIPKKCIQDCRSLTNITLPLNESQIIIGNKIFNTPHLEEDIYLPNSIKMINGNEVNESEFEIPTKITSLGENCFNNNIEQYNNRYKRYRRKDYDYENKRGKIIIPSTVKTIPKNCIENCWRLTNISLPLNESQIIIGNKIFNTPHLEQYIYLPQDIKMINGIEVDGLTSLEIPTTVTSLDEDCFHGFRNLQQLTIPETVIDIPFNIFTKLPRLQVLTIKSKNFIWNGNRLFITKEGCLYPIELPTSMKKVNNQVFKPIETFTIPTNVTKISDYCFANCEELTEIKGLENVKEFGKRCFFNCPKLYDFDNPIFDYYKPKNEYEMISKFQKEHLEEWTGLKCSEILFDSNVDDWSEETSVFDERIIGKKQLTFLIEDKDGEIFGYYLNTDVVEKYDYRQPTDFKSFEFNLQSQNNRLKQPMKFEGHFMYCDDGIWLFKPDDYYLIVLGNINLVKQNNKNESWCERNEKRLYYHGINKTLNGKSGKKPFDNEFTPKRIIVIQMK